MKEENENESKKNDQLNINTKAKENERDDISKKSEREEINKVQKTEENLIKKEFEATKERKKVSITPYKIDSSYKNKLLAALEKQNKKRPDFLVETDEDDIRENIDELNQKALEAEKLKENKEIEARTESTKKERVDIFKSYKTSASKGETLLQDPIALFAEAERVYIDQYYKLSDLFVICPLYYNYRISLEYCIEDNGDTKKLEAYHLFNTKEISPPCTHNFCPNQARDIDINIFNFVVGSTEKETQQFISIKKPYRCALSCLCACCTRPTFVIDSPVEELGKIIEIRTLCDPVLKVYDINDDEIYTITTKCCNCGYCMRDQLCGERKCAICKFDILDNIGRKLDGEIVKDHRSGKRIKPDYDQIIVKYPPNISCQDKILLMSGALILEYLYFQNLGNYKRCSGNPKYLNTLD